MKRLLDLVLLGLAMPVWLPVLAVLAVLVWLRMGRPVLFRQRRPGLQGRVFELLKFRTMTDGRDADGRPLPDAERLTSFGCWLRRISRSVWVKPYKAEVLMPLDVKMGRLISAKCAR